jgi:alkanesulfonate monooxygenase SsuD/methylene tetrahydromethanopterin reductase-like flavin-dependent oxidoreductase (luciferase family)
MKVGIFITNQQHLDADMISALKDQIAMVELARNRGWDSLFTGQHYLNEGNNKQLQPVPFLARLAAVSGDMTVGLGVLLLNLHNPVYTAETVATLDVIARGNFIFGVGLGYRDVEFDAFGVPKGQRVKRFEDYLALVQRLWTEDRVSYEDATCRLHDVRMNIRPVQKPRPLMGWSGRASAPPASEAGKGRQSQGVRHVPASQHEDRRNGRRYREELVPRRRPRSARSHCPAAKRGGTSTTYSSVGKTYAMLAAASPRTTRVARSRLARRGIPLCGSPHNAGL